MRLPWSHRCAKQAHLYSHGRNDRLRTLGSSTWLWNYPVPGYVTGCLLTGSTNNQEATALGSPFRVSASAASPVCGHMSCTRHMSSLTESRHWPLTFKLIFTIPPPPGKVGRKSPILQDAEPGAPKDLKVQGLQSL